jgi:hypothetical protein
MESTRPGADYFAPSTNRMMIGISEITLLKKLFFLSCFLFSLFHSQPKTMTFNTFWLTENVGSDRLIHPHHPTSCMPNMVEFLFRSDISLIAQDSLKHVNIHFSLTMLPSPTFQSTQIVSS